MGDEVLMFFLERPDALAIYEALEERLLGEVPDTRIVVQKTQIGFKGRHLFGCASFLPVVPKARRPDPYLTVTFGLDRPVRSGRIAAVVQIRPGRWTHHVVVGAPGEIDGELLGWLRLAHDFSEGKR